MLNKILGTAKLGYGRIMTCLIVALTAVQSFAAIELPADTETKLTSIVEGSFGLVIGVVVVIVGAGLLIKLVRKAG